MSHCPSEDWDRYYYDEEKRAENAELARRADCYDALLEALCDCALIVNGMWRGTLPDCFSPNLEMVNRVNAAIAKAEGK